jgi:hypothetical protein
MRLFRQVSYQDLGELKQTNVITLERLNMHGDFAAACEWLLESGFGKQGEGASPHARSA